MPKKLASKWKSRIVGHRKMDPAKLVAHPLNFRLHPESQRKALAAAIREIGFIRSVTVNKTTGRIIDGHERVYQAVEDGQTRIDVELVELSVAEERKALATLDAIGGMAEIDSESLARLLSDIGPIDGEMGDLFGDLAELAGMEMDPGDESEHVEFDAETGDPESEKIAPETFFVLAECETEAQQLEVMEWLDQNEIPSKLYAS